MTVVVCEISGNTVSPTLKGKRRPQEAQPSAQNPLGRSGIPEAKVAADQAIFLSNFKYCKDHLSSERSQRFLKVRWVPLTWWSWAFAHVTLVPFFRYKDHYDLLPISVFLHPCYTEMTHLSAFLSFYSCFLPSSSFFLSVIQTHLFGLSEYFLYFMEQSVTGFWNSKQGWLRSVNLG